MIRRGGKVFELQLDLTEINTSGEAWKILFV